ncbi:MAG: hypothetical protein V3W34_01080 [Phycisphaerae bacterium]
MSPRIPDRTCAEGFREEDCLALSGPANFLGIKSPCRGEEKDCLPAPTVTGWGMVALGMLLLIGLTVKFRRRATVEKGVEKGVRLLFRELQ